MIKKVLFASLFFSGFSFGQMGESFGGSFGFNVEAVNFERGQLNTYLDANNLEKGDLPEIGVGLVWNFVVDPLLITLDYSSSGTEENYTTSVVKNGFETFGVSIGYSLLEDHKYLLYPYVGFRSLTYSYTSRSFVSESTDFNQSLTQYNAFTAIQNRMYSADFGIGFTSLTSLGFSLKIGSNLPVVQSRWFNSLNDDKLNNGPDLKSLFYIKTAITFGGSHNDRDHYPEPLEKNPQNEEK